MRDRSRLLAFAVALSAMTARAATHIVVSGDTAGAEVCRFAARDRENPFARWFHSADVTCVAAGSDVAYPRGLWNVFARSQSGVSAETALVDGDAPPDALAFSLAPAAIVKAMLPPQTTAVVYAPKRAAAFPTGVVPAGEELWLFVVSKSAPIALFDIDPIAAGNERTIDARGGGIEGSVVTWTRIPDEDRQALEAARGVSAPDVAAISGAKTIAAIALPDLDRFSGAFALFRGVPAGPAELRLSGRGWLTNRQQIRVETGHLTVLPEPIVAAASAALIVNWSVAPNLGDLDRSIGTCEPARAAPRFELTISRCTAAKDNRSAPACQPLKSESLPLDEPFGTSTMNEIAPGLYRAELRYGKLPPVTETADVAPLSQRSLSVTAYDFSIRGDFTRGGKPLHDGATIEFPGDGIGFSERDSGEYQAVLKSGFDTDARIDIKTCGGEKAFVLADRPVSPRGGRFDIDIPDNSLSISVVDTFTHAMLTKSAAQMQIMSKTGRFPVATLDLGTGGTFSIRGVPQRELHIAVTCPGYKKKDLDPFSMDRSETKEIEVQLEPESGSQGRIVSSRPFKNAIVAWYSPSGSEIERVDLAADGSFTYDSDHYVEETMVVVSASHPLWVLHPPIVAHRETMQVTFPDAAPVRQAEISVPGVPPRVATVFGVAIGGLRVPQPALAQHQGLRDLTTVIRGEGPLLIPALAQTGPIDILRGPSQFVTVPQALEYFGLRDFAPVKTIRLEPGSAQVVFGR